MPDILSVGIDIGTSTTQLVFSRITMENTTGYFSVPRVSITGKQVIYKSEVYLTPLLTPVLIDGAAVREIVAGEYRRAGFTPAEVDTGAVIITGESARKENAESVLMELSRFAGEFVVSTAGPDLESVVAGKGSGAYQYSLDHDLRTVNLDIGGGTTNIVVFDSGVTKGRSCYDIGGRLIRLDRDLTVQSVSPSADRVARAVGVSLRPGARTSVEELRRVTDKMADLLAQALAVKPQEPLLEEVRTAGSSSMETEGKRPDRLFFSGGVADCMSAEKDSFPYGDIGVLLGRSIARGVLASSIPVVRGSETIRATVVGAGTYTTSISGSTITYAANLLPMKNIPALRLGEDEEQSCFRGDWRPLAFRLRWFLEQSGADQVIVALQGKDDPSYEELKHAAASLARAAEEVLAPERPLLVVLEKDIAKALGLRIREELGGRRKVVCIDGIRAEQGDYVDLGRPVMNGMVIPVVVKTLLFG